LLRNQGTGTGSIYKNDSGGNMSKETNGSEDIRITSSKPKTDNFKKRTQRLKSNRNLNSRTAVLWSVDKDMAVQPFERHMQDLDVAKLVSFLKDSNTARRMIFNQDGEMRADIMFDEQTIVSQYYPKHNMIALNPDRPMAELACVLVKEMRRACQYEAGNLHNPLEFDPDEAILINRAQQADALMVAIRVAWELKLLGQEQMWNFMIGAPFADVTRTFEIHAKNDFRSLNDGRAGRAAYDKWFEDQRTGIHDKRVIHQMLLEDSGAAEKGRETVKQLTDQMMARMADMPGGRNYLTISGHRSPMHAEYMEVEDRSNANFLWFVKFERNFQEKEAELLEESVQLSGEVIDFSSRMMELRRK